MDETARSNGKEILDLDTSDDSGSDNNICVGVRSDSGEDNGIVPAGEQHNAGNSGADVEIVDSANARPEGENAAAAAAAAVYAGDTWEYSAQDLQKGFDELSSNDVLKWTFKTDGEAERFYATYAKVMGFKMRREDVKHDKHSNMILYRKWVCWRQGRRRERNIAERRRPPKPTNRTGCPAAFRIRYDKTLNKYVVTKFTKEHNHEMAPPKLVPVQGPQGQVGKHVRPRKSTTGVAGLRQCQIMDYVFNEQGECHNRDMLNAIYVEHRYDLRDGVFEGILAYLTGKAEHDRGLYYKYDHDDENRVYRLFWADLKSILDYACFGDLVVLDRTYRENAYGIPFLMFTGKNNHRQTIIFGCALLGDETLETFSWVLETFLDAMNRKMPDSVISDGDGALYYAIKRLLPNSQHRLCSVQLHKSAASNVNDASFVNEFRSLMDEKCTPPEFEAAWTELVEKYGLQNHPWIVEIYSKRTEWAEAYLQEHFFAGVNTIPRLKGVSLFLNQFLLVEVKLHEFVKRYQEALSCLRQNAAKADIQSEQFYPILSTNLRDLEKHGADVFTKVIFEKFREEIVKETVLSVANREYVENEGCYIFYLTEYTKPDVTWKVRFKPTDQSLSCSCYHFKAEGFPCCHMISVMKAQHLREIPSSCIKERWTKDTQRQLESNQVPAKIIQMARYGVLSSKSNEMSDYASHTMEGFKEAINTISKLARHTKQLCVLNGQVGEPTSTQVGADVEDSNAQHDIHDSSGATATRTANYNPNNLFQDRSQGGNNSCNGHLHPTYMEVRQSLGDITHHRETEMNSDGQNGRHHEGQSQVTRPPEHRMLGDFLHTFQEQQ